MEVTTNADPAPRDEVTRAIAPPPVLQRLRDAIFSSDPRRRIRLAQWSIAALVYLASALVLVFGIGQGWMDVGSLVAWSSFLVLGLALVYVAIRSGWSEKFADPALTATQIVLGIIVVEWAYVICGPVRSVALYPLLLIFTFGAFSLSSRRLARLTAFALVSLVACVAARHVLSFGADWSLSNPDLRLDVTNVLMVTILLPALSLVASRLSALRFRLRSQRAELTEALRLLQVVAVRDELTGLSNRRHMQERLEEERSRFERTAHGFSIAVIDLDHFKDINDACGHAGGDEVLRRFAREAQTTLRGADVLGRWGGEEFLLLLPETSAEQAQLCVERLLARIRALPTPTGVPLSFSAGVTGHRQEDSLAETIARADQAMYAAKGAGRNAVRTF